MTFVCGSDMGGWVCDLWEKCVCERWSVPRRWPWPVRISTVCAARSGSRRQCHHDYDPADPGDRTQSGEQIEATMRMTSCSSLSPLKRWLAAAAVVLGVPMLQGRLDA